MAGLSDKIGGEWEEALERLKTPEGLEEHFKLSDTIGANNLQNTPKELRDFLRSNEEPIREALRKGGKENLQKIIGDLLLKHNNGTQPTQATGGGNSGETETEVDGNTESEVADDTVEVLNDIPEQSAVNPEPEANAERKKDNPDEGAGSSEDPNPETKVKVNPSDKDKADTDKKAGEEKEKKSKKKYGISIWDSWSFLNKEAQLIFSVLGDLLYVGGGFLILPPLKKHLIHPVRDFLGTHLPKFIRLGLAVMFKKLGEKIGVTDKRISAVKDSIKAPFVVLNQSMENYWSGKKEEEDKDKKQDRDNDNSWYDQEREEHDYKERENARKESLNDAESLSNTEEIIENVDQTEVNALATIKLDNPKALNELFHNTPFGSPENEIGKGNNTWTTNDHLGKPLDSKGTYLRNLDNLDQILINLDPTSGAVDNRIDREKGKWIKNMDGKFDPSKFQDINNPIDKNLKKETNKNRKSPGKGGLSVQ